MVGDTSETEHGEGYDAGWSFEDVLLTILSNDMLDFSGRRQREFDSTPVRSASAPGVESNFELVMLTSNEEWDDFHEAVITGVKHNLGPWQRCVALLRHHNVVLCVIERHYVCLDLRSEVSAFNSQLDSAIDRAATRLHFFARNIDNDDLLQLTDEQKNSYVGYIVLREPGSPIVGRSVIRKPDYVQVCATIDEPVNFFGQKLQVNGLPFMQQDERFAVCAHVAAWIIAYTAYRKGLIERAFISDVVSTSSGTTIMHPSAPVGLTAEQVQSVIQRLGLHLPLYEVANRDMLPFEHVDVADLNLSLDDLQQLETMATQLRLPSEGDHALTLHGNPRVFSAVFWWLAKHEAKDPGDVENDRDFSVADIYFRARSIIDGIIRINVQPFLISGFPIYCQTSGHAVVLCGFTEDDSGFVYYYHDDQFGPYVASRSIMGASRQDFRHQAHLHQAIDQFDPAPLDDFADPIHVADGGTKGDRGVEIIGFPSPARMLLSPIAAKNNVTEIITNASFVWYEMDGDDTPLSPLRASVIMGVDYKRQRRDELNDHSDRLVLSGLHLSEWVVVVEAIIDGMSVWEFVFDSTSSDTHPILQIARVGERLLYRNPLNPPDAETFRVGTNSFTPLSIPRRVGKVSIG